MLSFSKLSSDIIEFIVDNSSLKQEKLTPGTRIPIKSVDQLPNNQITLILLAWNFAREIIEDLKERGYSEIDIIQPLPENPRIYSMSDREKV